MEIPHILNWGNSVEDFLREGLGDLDCVIVMNIMCGNVFAFHKSVKINRPMVMCLYCLSCRGRTIAYVIMVKVYKTEVRAT